MRAAVEIAGLSRRYGRVQALDGVDTLNSGIGNDEAWRLFADLALVGLFGGFFIVPLYALVQQRSPADRARSQAVAPSSPR